MQLIHLLMEYFKLGIMNYKLLEFFVNSLTLYIHVTVHRTRFIFK